MKQEWPKLSDNEPRPASDETSGVQLEIACRAAFQILWSLPEREAKLAHQEPLPESSKHVLRQLPRVQNA